MEFEAPLCEFLSRVAPDLAMQPFCFELAGQYLVFIENGGHWCYAVIFSNDNLGKSNLYWN